MRQSDPRTEFERYFLQIPRAELGGLIKEYIAESNHGGWDGFDPHHVTGIKAFLADVLLYHKNYAVVGSSRTSKDLATHISNVNPVP